MFKVLTGTVNEGSNIFEITDNEISNDSIIEVYPGDESIIPVEVSVTGHVLLVTFDVKAIDDIPIKIFINNLEGEYIPPSSGGAYDIEWKDIPELGPQSVGDGLDTLVDYFNVLEEELYNKVPDDTIPGGVLYHATSGNTWKKLDASNLDYDEQSTIYSAMGNIDDLETTATNLVDAINEVKESGGGGGISYSTTEFETGKTWIDGKKIYCKVLTGATLSAGNNITSVSDLQIDTPINITMNVKVTLSGNTRWRPVPFTYWSNGSDPSWYGGVFYNYPEDTINAQLGSSLINGVNNWFIIVEYTKRG